jgi:adenosylhomocysteine nucleosidase
MKVVVSAAMKEELAPFRNKFATEEILSIGKTRLEKVIRNDVLDLYLLETGIGKVNAAFSATLLHQQLAVDLVINTGSAGSLSENVKVGDVVLSTSLTYSDVDATGFGYEIGQVPQMPSCYETKRFEELHIKGDFAYHYGLIVTADSFMDDQVRVNQVKNTAIAQVSTFYEVPILNIRGISDIAGKKTVATFNENLDLAAKNSSQVVLHLIESLG